MFFFEHRGRGVQACVVHRVYSQSGRSAALLGIATPFPIALRTTTISTLSRTFRERPTPFRDGKGSLHVAHSHSSSLSAPGGVSRRLDILGVIRSRGRLGLELLGVLLVLVDGPIEDVVVLEALTDEEIAEDLAEVGVVGLVVEAEGTSVVQVDGELVGEAAAQDFGGSGHLLLHDAVVLLLLGRRLQTLPGERATAEVEHDVAEGLHIVTAGLFWWMVIKHVPVGEGMTKDVPTPRWVLMEA